MQDGIYLWSPPAAVADVAIEKLTKARHEKYKGKIREFTGFCD